VRTVFVLDFTNLANAPDVDWMCGGIAETVSVDLRKIGGIRIVGGDAPSRQRVAAARASGPITSDVASNLGRSAGAHWVVWGGFQKSGARIRLTPQFSDVETGETFSVEKIDGNVDDIFELQDRIVTGLAERLRIEVTSLEAERIAKPETAKVSAYELYARGQRAILQFSKEGTRMAAEYFREAIAIDPEYALAWAGLGSLLMPKFISTGEPAVLEEGVHALQRALQLDPALGEPHVFLAYMYVHQRRFDEAIDEARASLARDPGAHMGWYLLASHYCRVRCRRRLSPISPERFLHFFAVTQSIHRFILRSWAWVRYTSCAGSTSRQPHSWRGQWTWSAEERASSSAVPSCSARRSMQNPVSCLPPYPC